jgi:nicotinate-nucleotide adenylyltransferase
MERIGILGGTFDPPHQAHVALAEESLRQRHLVRVLWVLTPDPPHKDDRITSYALRREMLQAALAGNPAFVLCEVESERPGPHYMTDTVRILVDRYRPAELTLLLGEDSLRDILTWHQPKQLIQLCSLTVMHRPRSKADLIFLEKAVPGITAKTFFLDTPLMDISSTRIRKQINKGEDIPEQVPDAVGEIIQRNALYR